MLSIILLSCITLLLAAYLHFVNNKRPAGFPPGPSSLPMVGNLHQIGLEPHKSFVNLGNKYGGLFSVDYGSYRSVVSNELSLIKQCLNDSAFSGRPKFRIFQAREGPNFSYSRGIALSESNHWVEQRRFALRHLRDFGYGKSTMEGIIHEEVSEVIETLQKAIGKPIMTRSLFNIAVVNSLWRICTGSRMSHEDPKLQKLIVDVNNTFSGATPLAFFFPIITKLFPNMSGYNDMVHGFKEVARFVTEEYDAHKATIVEGEPRDLLDVMIQEVEATTDPKSSFYKEEGKASVIKSLEDLFMAGTETTSTALSWIFLLMAVHTDLQDKLQREIDFVVEPSRLPGLSDRQSMPFAECIIMETLRFVTLIPLSVMRNTMEDANVAGYTIPKDTVFTPNLYAVSHDKDIWGDPEVFRPERFLLPDGTANKAHEAFIPFSYGKRMCIGEKLAREELFLFTTGLFQKFRVTLNPKDSKPSLKPRSTVVLSPNPHELVLLERKLSSRL